MLKLKQRAVFSCVILSFLYAGCASSGKGNVSAQSVQEEALEIAKSTHTLDSKEFQEIDRLYRGKQYKNVIAKSVRFGKKRSGSRFIAQVFHIKALSAIALKNYSQAQIDLKKVIDHCKQKTEHDNLLSMAQFNLAFVFFEVGRADDTIKTLDLIDINSFTKSNRAKYHLLKSKALRLDTDYFRSADAAYSAIKEDPALATKGFHAFLDELLDKIEATPPALSQFEQLSVKHDDSIALDKLHYRIGKLKPKTAVIEAPKGVEGSTVGADVDSSVVDTKKIGVIVTLSGKFGKFGQRVLQGLALAFNIYNYKSKSSTIELVVYDDQGDANRAMAAIDELYHKHHVVAIVGPISSKLVEPLSQKAEQFGLPLISLGQKDLARQAGGNSYVFSAGITPSMQAHELIRYAKDKANVKDFAILAPSSKFGEEHSRAFWDELDRKGLAVRGYETYSDDETDFKVYIDKLVGLNALDTRSSEINELNELKQAVNLKLKIKSKKMDRLFTLKPIIDFQAVFIPDEPRLLGQILPTFAYRDVDRVLFLGINTWNSSELVARASQSAQGSVFVDGFFARSMKPSVQKFIEDYRKIFGSDPISMDALAFDAGNILDSILNNRLGKNSSMTRSDLREKLYNLKDFPGLSGPIQGQDGRLFKSLHFLTLKGGKIEEIAF